MPRRRRGDDDGRPRGIAAQLCGDAHLANLDGTGYPDGLAGSAIPLEARIVRITDAFDAMTNRRPYADARSFEDALEELARFKGQMFDPELVELIIPLVRDPALASSLRALRARPFPGESPVAA